MESRAIKSDSRSPIGEEKSDTLSQGSLPRTDETASTLSELVSSNLGKPIPNSPYAVSVSMPTWRDVVEYEEGAPRVTNALQSGYPRFAIKGLTAQFLETLKKQYCDIGEELLAFPSPASAQRCLDFVRREFPGAGRVIETDFRPITACLIPEYAYKAAKAYWQHTGEIISARLAEDCLHGVSHRSTISSAKEILCDRLANLASVQSSQVSLFPSGMAGFAAIQRAVQASAPGVKTAQVGFPYVDSLKLQDKFGSGYIFYSGRGSQANIEQQLNELNHRASTGNISAIYCEFPTNPLLTVPPLDRLWEISIRNNIPLIVDETLGTLANVRVLPFATAIVTSLTKYVSGTGDVCAGSVIWNNNHPSYEKLHAHWHDCYEDQLHEGDAIALEKNSRDFTERMSLINSGAAQLVDYLANHSSITELNYPNRDVEQRQIYDRFRTPEGGYGGLLSIRIRGGEPVAAKVYDALEIYKGPSLGTNFTIACPYTLLAHFHELDYAANLGIASDLIRISVGMEDPAELIARFERALAIVS